MLYFFSMCFCICISKALALASVQTEPHLYCGSLTIDFEEVRCSTFRRYCFDRADEANKLAFQSRCYTHIPLMIGIADNAGKLDLETFQESPELDLQSRLKS